MLIQNDFIGILHVHKETSRACGTVRANRSLVECALQLDTSDQQQYSKYMLRTLTYRTISIARHLLRYPRIPLSD
jgi:hypothetical protein